MSPNEREIDRVRWRCRRGMLELDLVLDAFTQRHLRSLDGPRLAAFARLLERIDPELLDLVMGREEVRDAHEREVLALVRVASSCAAASTPTPDLSPLTPALSPEGRMAGMREGEIRVVNG